MSTGSGPDPDGKAAWVAPDINQKATVNDNCPVCSQPRRLHDATLAREAGVYHLIAEAHDLDGASLAAPPRKVATDCCARLLPVEQTTDGDVHFPDMCPACVTRDGREHDSHVTCTDGQCPGRDWSCVNGQIVPRSTDA